MIRCKGKHTQVHGNVFTIASDFTNVMLVVQKFLNNKIADKATANQLLLMLVKHAYAVIEEDRATQQIMKDAIGNLLIQVAEDKISQNETNKETIH